MLKKNIFNVSQISKNLEKEFYICHRHLKNCLFRFRELLTKPAENVSLTSTCPSKVTKFVFGLRLISFLVFSLIVRNVCFDSSPSNKSFRWWWEARWRRWLSDVKQRRNLIKNAISFSSFVRSERRRFLELADTFCLWGLSDASVCVAAKDYWHLSGDWKFSYGVLWLLCSAEYSLTYDSSVANRQQQINFFQLSGELWTLVNSASDWNVVANPMFSMDFHISFYSFWMNDWLLRRCHHFCAHFPSRFLVSRILPAPSFELRVDLNFPQSDFVLFEMKLIELICHWKWRAKIATEHVRHWKSEFMILFIVFGGRFCSENVFPSCPRKYF